MTSLLYVTFDTWSIVPSYADSLHENTDSNVYTLFCLLLCPDSHAPCTSALVQISPFPSSGLSVIQDGHCRPIDYPDLVLLWSR